MGDNVIGRKGNSSKASIQIATTDRYMSRQHCRINVSSLSDKSLKVVLCDYQNKNMTSVNDHAIVQGDEIRLMDGDKITMGETTLTFKLS
jgi:predicted component of type VI protein secretion system